MLHRKIFMRNFVFLTLILVFTYSPNAKSSDFSIDECDQFEECVEATNSSFSSSSSQSSNSNSSSNSSASNTASGNEVIADKKEKTSEISSVEEAAKNSNLPDDTIKGDNGSTPKDIPDIATDDTTAKQLRAEAEGTNDPELKALYWDAYRQYKGIKTKN